jgi:hypothetical protein
MLRRLIHVPQMNGADLNWNFEFRVPVVVPQSMTLPALSCSVFLKQNTGIYLVLLMLLRGILQTPSSFGDRERKRYARPDDRREHGVPCRLKQVAAALHLRLFKIERISFAMGFMLTVWKHKEKFFYEKWNSGEAGENIAPQGQGPTEGNSETARNGCLACIPALRRQRTH